MFPNSQRVSDHRCCSSAELNLTCMGFLVKVWDQAWAWQPEQQRSIETWCWGFLASPHPFAVDGSVLKTGPECIAPKATLSVSHSAGEHKAKLSMVICFQHRKQGWDQGQDTSPCEQGKPPDWASLASSLLLELLDKQLRSPIAQSRSWDLGRSSPEPAHCGDAAEGWKRGSPHQEAGTAQPVVTY